MAAPTRLRTHAAAQKVTCEDCYFRQQSLCALALDNPCPTFRTAGLMLLPPQQPRLVARTVGAAA